MQAFLCCTLARLTSKMVSVQRSHTELQGTSSCCWDSELQRTSQQKHTRQSVSRQGSCHTAGRVGKKHATQQCQSCTFIPGYILQSAVQLQRVTLRVLSVFRSRDILESGKKKCSRPKLSRSFRQTSLANAFMAPGYCTGSRRTTCKQIEPVMMRSCCFAVVLW